MNNIIKNNCFLDLRQASNLTVETIMLYSILLFYFVILLNVNFDKCLSCDLEDVFTRKHAVCPLKNDISLVSIHLIIFTPACLAQGVYVLLFHDLYVLTSFCCIVAFTTKLYINGVGWVNE